MSETASVMPSAILYTCHPREAPGVPEVDLHPPGVDAYGLGPSISSEANNKS